MTRRARFSHDTQVEGLEKVVGIIRDRNGSGKSIITVRFSADDVREVLSIEHNGMITEIPFSTAEKLATRVRIKKWENRKNGKEQSEDEI